MLTCVHKFKYIQVVVKLFWTLFVVPVKTGTQFIQRYSWIPAFAGMANFSSETGKGEEA